ncbi:MAG: helix-turn-helix domain-containing protein [Planctomycetota bacterium]
MTSREPHNRASIPLLDRAETPLYVVDAGREIAFANDSLADWVGAEIGAILGSRVEYHAAAAAAGKALFTGLCPSPRAMAGSEVVGTISTVSRNGRLRQRRARFVPLADRGSIGGDAVETSVLVIAERADLTSVQVAELVGGGTPDGLHAALRRFRAERAAGTPLALLGVSPTTVSLRARFDAAAASGCNALVAGGTRADRIDLAEALHDATASQAPQRGVPAQLVPLDGVLAGHEELSEATERLASTGASTTLLLIDADRLPRDLQASLASHLGGGLRSRVLATVDDPKASLPVELESIVGTVRLDLVTLAERRSDLPLLVQYFVEQQNAESGKQVAGIADDAMERLSIYPFRNIDQLRSMVAAGHRSCRNAVIARGDLPPTVEQAALAAELSQPEERLDLDQLLADVEREVVKRALDRARDNKAEAARLLGLTRQRFYRLLERINEAPADAPGEAVR